MESKINTSAIVTALQIGASITINSVSETVNVLTFSSDFAECILDSPSSFYASIFRPTLSSGDTAEALVNATSQPPRIIAYNQTGSAVAGIPAYSIVVQPWTNGYTAAIGDVVIFEPATNPIANQNYIVGTCAEVSSSMIQGETCFRGALRDIYRLKNRVDGLANTDLSSLLTDDYSVNSGGIVCASASLTLGYTAGTGRYTGQNFSFNAGSISGLTGKTCYRAIVKQDGTNLVQAENATGGSIDATYSPSGTASLPTASTPIWTASGTASVETVTNSALNLAVSSNYRVYDRAGAAGPPASGTTLDAIVLWVSGTNASRIEIDDGTSRDSVIINQSSITLESTGQTFALDCTQWTWIRLTLKNDLTNVYVNGSEDPVLSSSNALATITNRFRFGNYLGYSGSTPQNATGECKFAYVRTIGSGELIPAFPTLTGTVLGSAITSASGQTQTVGIQTSALDVRIGQRREGRLVGESDLIGIPIPELPDVQALALGASVGSNALTIKALFNNINGETQTPSTSASPKIKFRSAILTSGFKVTRSITSALSVVIPSGTTIGTPNSYPLPIHLYALDNAGTVELAVSLKGDIDTTVLQSTTAISGGASAKVLYSTTARSNVAVVYLGKLLAPQATAGTWASSPTSISLCNQDTANRILLSSQTVAAVATIDFASFITSAFGSYEVEYNVLPATDQASFWLRTSTDNGATYDSGASDYSWSGNTALTATAQVDAADAQIDLILNGAGTAGARLSNVAGEGGLRGTLKFYNPTDAVYFACIFENMYNAATPNPAHVVGGGLRLSSADVNAVRFLMSTGNITGTIKLYGKY